MHIIEYFVYHSSLKYDKYTIFQIMIFTNKTKEQQQQSDINHTQLSKQEKRHQMFLLQHRQQNLKISKLFRTFKRMTRLFPWENILYRHLRINFLCFCFVVSKHSHFSIILYYHFLFAKRSITAQTSCNKRQILCFLSNFYLCFHTKKLNR